MLLNDALENLRRASTIPDAVRIDHRYRSLLANAQTIRLGAVNATLAHQTEFIQAFFQIAPGREAGFLL
jgi:hypothetical protein